MAMACRLVGYGYNVRVLVCAEIADYLSQGNIEPLFQEGYLFILDLQVWPAVFGGERELKNNCSLLLTTRARLADNRVLQDPNQWGGPETLWGLFFSWWFRPSDFMLSERA